MILRSNRHFIGATIMFLNAVQKILIFCSIREMKKNQTLCTRRFADFGAFFQALDVLARRAIVTHRRPTAVCLTTNYAIWNMLSKYLMVTLRTTAVTYHMKRRPIYLYCTNGKIMAIG